MNRRSWLVAAFVCSPVAGAHGQAPGAPSEADAGLRSLAVLDFELVEENPNPLTREATQARLRRATGELQAELAAQRLYRIVDPAPSAALQARLREQQAFLYRCDDCADQVGRLLGTELVMQTWVQKVSELILNLNVQVWDVAAQKVIFSKSVDMRSNDDVSWRRAVRYLVRDMADKRALNPRYAR